MPEFKVDVMICVSAYVTADTEDDAKEIFLEEFGQEDKDNPPYLELYIGPMNKHVYLSDDITLSSVATSYGFDPAQIENMDE